MSTFTQYLQYKGLSKSTRSSIQKEVYSYLSWNDTENTEAEIISYRELLGYVYHLKNKKLSQRSIQHHINSIRHYYNWLITLGKREDNPTKMLTIQGIQKITQHLILSKEELHQLYQNYTQKYAEKTIHQRNTIIISFLMYQGITTSELQKLELTDINLKEGNVHIRSTRRSNERTLALQSFQILPIMEYISTIRPLLLQKTNLSNHLFISSTGKNKLGNVLQNLHKQLQPLHAKYTSYRQIRASVITHWLKQYNLREVQYKAGHKYISSTEAYQSNNIEDLQRDIEKYHTLE